MIDKKLVITEYNNSITGFLMNGLKAERILFDDSTKYRVGSVYVGKVKTVKKDINAAFVDLEDGFTGFLPFDEINESCLLNRSYDGRIIEGDEICVMVQKEAVKTKLCALTMHIELPGSFCVAVLDSDRILASTKLDKQTALHLCDNLSNDLPNGTGLIVRTNAKETSYDNVLDEALRLTSQLNHIISTMKTRKVYSCLYESKPSFVSKIEDIPLGSFSEIVTDSAKAYETLLKFPLKSVFQIRFYDDDSLSLKALYCLERAVSEATGKTVYLPSGGYIVIEPTEALTVIDVNSGKALTKKSTEDNYDEINKEAALEIARQLQLRNIFGIIIVDFINYKDSKRAEELLSYFRKTVTNDYSKTTICDITSLGLVEVTRTKKYGSIYDYKKIFDK